tara:strand:- start:10609 stop:11580 length:972 start_codon:yes stop_codon:yes gene_type:complete
MSISEYASDTEHEHGANGESGDMHPPIPWTEAHENILVEWADKAMCYRWLHTKAHAQYSHANTMFTIPVIIMSTVTGTANFAQDKFPEGIKEYATMGIGAVNIFAGILTTIAQFLKISELNEAHRVAGIAWDKFYRNIKVELAKTPSERIPVIQMLKIAKEEFDRLMETSPAIPEQVTALFESTFTEGKKLGELAEDELSARQKSFLALKKPEICDELVSCKQYVYREPASEKATKGLKGAMSAARKAVRLQRQQERIEKVITHFFDTRQRAPTEDEIIGELEDEDVSTEIVARALTAMTSERKNTVEGELPDENQIIGADNV